MKSNYQLKLFFHRAAAGLLVCCLTLPSGTGHAAEAVYPVLPTAQAALEGRTEPRGSLFDSEAGYVSQSYQGRPDRAPVIFLKDAHANISAQENIQKIITQVSQRHPDKPVFCLLEGAEGFVSPAPVSAFLQNGYDQRRRLLDLALINGPELAALHNERVVMWGIEEMPLYEEHLRAWKKAVSQSEPNLRAVDSFLSRARDRLWTEASPGLRALLEAEEESEKANPDLTRVSSLLGGFIKTYRKELYETASKKPVSAYDLRDRYPELYRFFQLQFLENEIERLPETKFPKAAALHTEGQKDTGAFSLLSEQKTTMDVSEAMRPVLPPLELKFLREDHAAGKLPIPQPAAASNLKAHPLPPEIPVSQNAVLKKFLRTQERVDAAALAAEIKTFIMERKKENYASPEEEAYEKVYQKALLARKLVNLELTSEEAAALDKKGEGGRENFIEFVSETGEEESSWSPDGALQYYALALQRDGALARNLIDFIASKPADSIVFLYAGGFHEAGITKILRDHDLSYAVINPVISQADVQDDLERYHRILTWNPLRDFSALAIRTALASHPEALIRDFAEGLLKKTLADASSAELSRRLRHTYELELDGRDRGALMLLGYSSQEIGRYTAEQKRRFEKLLYRTLQISDLAAAPERSELRMIPEGGIEAEKQEKAGAVLTSIEFASEPGRVGYLFDFSFMGRGRPERLVLYQDWEGAAEENSRYLWNPEEGESGFRQLSAVMLEDIDIREEDGRQTLILYGSEAFRRELLEKGIIEGSAARYMGRFYDASEASLDGLAYELHFPDSAGKDRKSGDPEPGKGALPPLTPNSFRFASSIEELRPMLAEAGFNAASDSFYRRTRTGIFRFPDERIIFESYSANEDGKGGPHVENNVGIAINGPYEVNIDHANVHAKGDGFMQVHQGTANGSRLNFTGFRGITFYEKPDGKKVYVYAWNYARPEELRESDREIFGNFFSGKFESGDEYRIVIANEALLRKKLKLPPAIDSPETAAIKKQLFETEQQIPEEPADRLKTIIQSIFETAPRWRYAEPLHSNMQLFYELDRPNSGYKAMVTDIDYPSAQISLGDLHLGISQAPQTQRGLIGVPSFWSVDAADILDAKIEPTSSGQTLTLYLPYKLFETYKTPSEFEKTRTPENLLSLDIQEIGRKRRILEREIVLLGDSGDEIRLVFIEPEASAQTSEKPIDIPAAADRPKRDADSAPGQSESQIPLTGDAIDMTDWFDLAIPYDSDALKPHVEAFTRLKHLFHARAGVEATFIYSNGDFPYFYIAATRLSKRSAGIRGFITKGKNEFIGIEAEGAPDPSLSLVHWYKNQIFPFAKVRDLEYVRVVPEDPGTGRKREIHVRLKYTGENLLESLRAAGKYFDNLENVSVVYAPNGAVIETPESKFVILGASALPQAVSYTLRKAEEMVRFFQTQKDIFGADDRRMGDWYHKRSKLARSNLEEKGELVFWFPYGDAKKTLLLLIKGGEMPSIRFMVKQESREGVITTKDRYISEWLPHSLFDGLRIVQSSGDTLHFEILVPELPENVRIALSQQGIEPGKRYDLTDIDEEKTGDTFIVLDRQEPAAQQGQGSQEAQPKAPPAESGTRPETKDAESRPADTSRQETGSVSSATEPPATVLSMNKEELLRRIKELIPKLREAAPLNLQDPLSEEAAEYAARIGSYFRELTRWNPGLMENYYGSYESAESLHYKPRSSLFWEDEALLIFVRGRNDRASNYFVRIPMAGEAEFKGNGPAGLHVVLDEEKLLQKKEIEAPLIVLPEEPLETQLRRSIEAAEGWQIEEYASWGEDAYTAAFNKYGITLQVPDMRIHLSHDHIFFSGYSGYLHWNFNRNYIHKAYVRNEGDKESVHLHLYPQRFQLHKYQISRIVKSDSYKTALEEKEGLLILTGEKGNKLYLHFEAPAETPKPGPSAEGIPVENIAGQAEPPVRFHNAAAEKISGITSGDFLFHGYDKAAAETFLEKALLYANASDWPRVRGLAFNFFTRNPEIHGNGGVAEARRFLRAAGIEEISPALPHDGSLERIQDALFRNFSELASGPDSTLYSYAAPDGTILLRVEFQETDNGPEVEVTLPGGQTFLQHARDVRLGFRLGELLAGGGGLREAGFAEGQPIIVDLPLNALVDLEAGPDGIKLYVSDTYYRFMNRNLSAVMVSEALYRRGEKEILFEIIPVRNEDAEEKETAASGGPLSDTVRAENGGIRPEVSGRPILSAAIPELVLYKTPEQVIAQLISGGFTRINPLQGLPKAAAENPPYEEILYKPEESSDALRLGFIFERGEDAAARFIFKTLDQAHQSAAEDDDLAPFLQQAVKKDSVLYLLVEGMEDWLLEMFRGREKSSAVHFSDETVQWKFVTVEEASSPEGYERYKEIFLHETKDPSVQPDRAANEEEPVRPLLAGTPEELLKQEVEELIFDLLEEPQDFSGPRAKESYKEIQDKLRLLMGDTLPENFITYVEDGSLNPVNLIWEHGRPALIYKKDETGIYYVFFPDGSSGFSAVAREKPALIAALDWQKLTGRKALDEPLMKKRNYNLSDRLRESAVEKDWKKGNISNIDQYYPENETPLPPPGFSDAGSIAALENYAKRSLEQHKITFWGGPSELVSFAFNRLEMTLQAGAQVNVRGWSAQGASWVVNANHIYDYAHERADDRDAFTFYLYPQTFEVYKRMIEGQNEVYRANVRVGADEIIFTDQDGYTIKLLFTKNTPARDSDKKSEKRKKGTGSQTAPPLESTAKAESGDFLVLKEKVRTQIEADPAWIRAADEKTYNSKDEVIEHYHWKRGGGEFDYYARLRGTDSITLHIPGSSVTLAAHPQSSIRVVPGRSASSLAYDFSWEILAKDVFDFQIYKIDPAEITESYALHLDEKRFDEYKEKLGKIKEPPGGGILAEQAWREQSRQYRDWISIDEEKKEITLNGSWKNSEIKLIFKPLLLAAASAGEKVWQEPPELPAIKWRAHNVLAPRFQGVLDELFSAGLTEERFREMISPAFIQQLFEGLAEDGRNDTLSNFDTDQYPTLLFETAETAKGKWNELPEPLLQFLFAYYEFAPEWLHDKMARGMGAHWLITEFNKLRGDMRGPGPDERSELRRSAMDELYEELMYAEQNNIVSIRKTTGRLRGIILYIIAEHVSSEFHIEEIAGVENPVKTAEDNLFLHADIESIMRTHEILPIHAPAAAGPEDEIFFAFHGKKIPAFVHNDNGTQTLYVRSALMDSISNSIRTGDYAAAQKMLLVIIEFLRDPVDASQDNITAPLAEFIGSTESQKTQALPYMFIEKTKVFVITTSLIKKNYGIKRSLEFMINAGHRIVIAEDETLDTEETKEKFYETYNLSGLIKSLSVRRINSRSGMISQAVIQSLGRQIGNSDVVYIALESEKLESRSLPPNTEVLLVHDDALGLTADKRADYPVMFLGYRILTEPEEVKKLGRTVIYYDPESKIWRYEGSGGSEPVSGDLLAEMSRYRALEASIKAAA